MPGNPEDTEACERIEALERQVAEQHRTAAALRRSEKHYRRLFESMWDAFVQVDMAGRITDFNTAFERMVGHPREAIYALSYVDLTPPRWHAMEARIVQAQILPRGYSEVYEKEYIRADGTVFPVELRTFLIADEADRPEAMWAIVRDISERRQAEARREQDRRKLLALMDGIEGVIYVADPETYELLHVNEACRRIWGENIVGRKCYAVLQQRDTPCPFCTNDRIFGDYRGRAYVWEFCNEVDGRWYRCADKAIQWTDGRLVRFEHAADITPLKRAEQELQQTLEELRRSNRDLEQFAYAASHDLQEPLRLVAGYTELLAERYGDRLDDKGRKFIHYAADGARRMQALIQDLLTFSRVTTRGRDFEEVDVSSALESAIDNLSAAIEENGARVTRDRLPPVRGDESQLTLLFQNLIGNAIKFRGADPPRVHVTAHAEDGNQVFSIRDNGIGIDAGHQERIFTIFQRLHSREEYPGTGVGLALCQRIVERHGGRIWCESTPGGGATFSFTLPKG